jgi:hypothetical protein
LPGTTDKSHFFISERIFLNQSFEVAFRHVFIISPY